MLETQVWIVKRFSSGLRVRLRARVVRGELSGIFEPVVKDVSW
jgi:hypothetical protein